MPKLQTNTEQLSRRIEAAADGLAESPLVRLFKEDRVGRWFIAATAAGVWFSVGLLDPRVAVLAAACALVTWIRLRRLPPPPEPDPDDWL